MHPQGPTLGPIEDSSRRWRPWCGWWIGHLRGKEGMGTKRTANPACWPPQAEEDVGYLISILATGLWLGTPGINTFRGNAMLGTVVPWGTMCQGPLPRISGLGEYCQVIERGSGRYQYMGPTTSLAHILQKLTIIFGTLASFDVLMHTKWPRVTMRGSPPLPQG